MSIQGQTRQDQTRAVRQIGGLAEISDRYDVILCDLWGVLHNGVAAFPPASDALAAFRRRGGTVILITNAPRPSAPVRRQLLKLGVAPDAFDDIATSGDVTIGLIAERIDEPVLHIGPARDLSLFEAAAEAAGRQPRLVAPLEAARYALCTGLARRRGRDARRLRGGAAAMAARAHADDLRQSGHRHPSRRDSDLLRRRARRVGSRRSAGTSSTPASRTRRSTGAPSRSRRRRAAARSTTGGCSRSATA